MDLDFQLCSNKAMVAHVVSVLRGTCGFWDEGFTNVILDVVLLIWRCAAKGMWRRLVAAVGVRSSDDKHNNVRVWIVRYTSP